MTRAEVSEKIARMKAVQSGLIKAVWSDYNDQRRFQVREIEVNGKVVSRLMKIDFDTNLKYLPSEDLFNEIYDLHVGSGHCGRDLLNKNIKEKFANVRRPWKICSDVAELGEIRASSAQGWRRSHTVPGHR